MKRLAMPHRNRRRKSSLENWNSVPGEADFLPWLGLLAWVRQPGSTGVQHREKCDRRPNDIGLTKNFQTEPPSVLHSIRVAGVGGITERHTARCADAFPSWGLCTPLTRCVIQTELSNQNDLQPLFPFLYFYWSRPFMRLPHIPVSGATPSLVDRWHTKWTAPHLFGLECSPSLPLT